VIIVDDMYHCVYCCCQGGAVGGGTDKAVKTEEFDLDIEAEARGNRVTFIHIVNLLYYLSLLSVDQFTAG